MRLFSNPNGALVELRGYAARRGGKPTVRIRRSRQVQRRLTEDEVDRLVDEYLAGATTGDLAARFGIHEHTVSTHLERRGVGRRYRLLDDAAVEVAAGLYERGWSLARVGQHFGVQAGTVLRADNGRLGVLGRNQLDDRIAKQLHDVTGQLDSAVRDIRDVVFARLEPNPNHAAPD